MGETVAVICDTGYSGSGTVTCGTDGQFGTLTCVANICTPSQVLNSNKAATSSITGSFIFYLIMICFFFLFLIFSTFFC